MDKQKSLSIPFQLNNKKEIMQRPFYTDRDALQRNIEKCGQTVKTFQEAIEKEQETIFELKGYLKELDAWELYKSNAGITE